MQIEINLWADYITELRNQIIAAGFVLAGNESDEDIFISIYNLQKRKVTDSPRKIFFSKEFNCPQNYKNALDSIVDKIKRGDNITPYLSTKIRYLDYADLMLNAWGVHHLHLGMNILPSGFIERTGDLLFIYFSHNEAFFINIFNHDDFTNQSILQIIHYNWPKLIEQYKLHDVKDISFKPSDSELKSLRKSHINTMAKMDDGTIYSPIGLGYATNGTAISITMDLINTKKMFKKVEKAIRNSVDTEGAFHEMEKLTFSLQFIDGIPFAVELNTNIAYRLAEIPGEESHPE
jgi:hypothetical protein